MKVVGLLSFRDEEAFLPYMLASLSTLVDTLVALDDRSVDGGPDLLRDVGATVLRAPARSTFGARRQLLLEQGRRAGGTHFVMVDADEAFTASFARHGRAMIESSLRPGEAWAVPFLTLWKGSTQYRMGREYDLPLTCIFGDDGTSSYANTPIHEARFPGRNTLTTRRLDHDTASMVHFQFTAWERAQVKQAWYRCKELLDGLSASRVNARYVATLDGRRVRCRHLDPALIAHLPSSAPLTDLPPSWHLEELLGWFGTHGPAWFEPLQIWHVPQLMEAFTQAENRPPHAQRFAPHLARAVLDAQGKVRGFRSRLANRRKASAD